MRFRRALQRGTSEGEIVGLEGGQTLSRAGPVADRCRLFLSRIRERFRGGRVLHDRQEKRPRDQARRARRARSSTRRTGARRGRPISGRAISSNDSRRLADRSSGVVELGHASMAKPLKVLADRDRVGADRFDLEPVARAEVLREAPKARQGRRRIAGRPEQPKRPHADGELARSSETPPSAGDSRNRSAPTGSRRSRRSGTAGRPCAAAPARAGSSRPRPGPGRARRAARFPAWRRCARARPESRRQSVEWRRLEPRIGCREAAARHRCRRGAPGACDHLAHAVKRLAKRPRRQTLGPDVEAQTGPTTQPRGAPQQIGRFVQRRPRTCRRSHRSCRRVALSRSAPMMVRPSPPVSSITLSSSSAWSTAKWRTRKPTERPL